MKILHIITGLENGGAETTLYRLAAGDQKNTHQVISLMGEGWYGEYLKKAEIPVYTVEMLRGSFSLKGLYQLVRLINRLQPDVVQTWMYHANLAGGIAARVAGVKYVFWGIRGIHSRKSLMSVTTRVMIYVCVLLSRWIPWRIIVNSLCAARYHINAGYPAKKVSHIHNGYPLDVFRYDREKAALFRRQSGIGQSDVLLGMVARFNSFKDHENLLRALSLLKQQGLDFTCVLVGTGMDFNNDSLVDMLRKYAVLEEVKLIGASRDIPAVMSALDVHVLSSVCESFPNVLSEAMLCGTPCVSTDVGDAALIVGETGWIVPPSNSRALSSAIRAAMREMQSKTRWERRKKSCVDHITRSFSLDRMTDHYHALWSLASSKDTDHA